jgi:phenylacetate-coenzyme A ligase PaaK-like adenylate-forming protein
LSHEDPIDRAHRELDQLARLSPDVFAAGRNRRFRRLLEHHAHNTGNTAYAELLRSHGLDPFHDLPADLAGIECLPIIDRQFLLEANYAEHPAIAMEQVSNRITSSGTTTGSPLRIPISYAAAQRMYGENLIRSFILVGADRVLREPSYFIAHHTPEDPEAASYIAFCSLRNLLGESVWIRSTRDPLEEHLRVLFGHRPRYSCTAANFYLSLLAMVQDQGMDLSRCSLDYVVLGGASLLDQDYTRLKDGLGLQRLALAYVCSETGFMGVQPVDKGPYTIFDDLYLVEVLDDEGHHVAPGERGRIAITSFVADAAPMIRYLIGDVATYLGRDSTFPNLTALADIGRAVGAIIGAGKISFEEIAGWPQQMTLRGVPVLAAQLVRRKTADRLDQAIIRVESPSDDIARITEVAIAVFRLNYQMDYLISDGEIPLPIVEVYRPGQLRAGKFKLRPFVDESHIVVGEALVNPDIA